MAEASTAAAVKIKREPIIIILLFFMYICVYVCIRVNVHPGDTRRPHFVPICLIQSKFKSLGGRWHKSSSASSLEPAMLINKHLSAYLRMTIQSAHLPTGYECISGSKLSDLEMYTANRLSIRRAISALVRTLIFAPRCIRRGRFPFIIIIRLDQSAATNCTPKLWS